MPSKRVRPRKPGPKGKLETAQRELRVQFTRIAQLQAELDEVRSKKPSQRSSGTGWTGLA